MMRPVEGNQARKLLANAEDLYDRMHSNADKAPDAQRERVTTGLEHLRATKEGLARLAEALLPVNRLLAEAQDTVRRWDDECRGRIVAAMPDLQAVAEGRLDFRAVERVIETIRRRALGPANGLHQLSGQLLTASSTALQLLAPAEALSDFSSHHALASNVLDTETVTLLDSLLGRAHEFRERLARAQRLAAHWRQAPKDLALHLAAAWELALTRAARANAKRVVGTVGSSHQPFINDTVAVPEISYRLHRARYSILNLQHMHPSQGLARQELITQGSVIHNVELELARLDLSDGSRELLRRKVDAARTLYEQHRRRLAALADNELARASALPAARARGWNRVRPLPIRATRW